MDAFTGLILAAMGIGFAILAIAMVILLRPIVVLLRSISARWVFRVLDEIRGRKK